MALLFNAVMYLFIAIMKLLVRMIICVSDSENQDEKKAVSKPHPKRTPVKRKRPQSHGK